MSAALASSAATRPKNRKRTKRHSRCLAESWASSSSNATTASATETTNKPAARDEQNAEFLDRRVELLDALEADSLAALQRVDKDTARAFVLGEADSVGAGALIKAILRNRNASAAWLIGQGISLGARTLVSCAVEDDLLKLGVTTTALHVAALLGDLQAGIDLIAGGADVNARDNQGCTPLFAALTVRFAEFLIRAGARADIVCDRGYSALNSACFFDACGVLKLLLAGGANIHAFDEFGTTALHACALGDATKSIILILAAGACPDAIDTSGRTPLDVALQFGRPRCIGILVDAIAKAQKLSNEDLACDRMFRLVAVAPSPSYGVLSPLIHCDSNEHAWTDAPNRVACFRSLCTAGAKLETRNAKGLSELDLALLSSSTDIPLITTLLEAGAKCDHSVRLHGTSYTPFGLALRKSKPELIDAFLALTDAGSDSVVKHITGSTALMYALQTDETDDAVIVRRLLPNANLQLRDSTGASGWQYVYQSKKWINLVAEFMSASLRTLVESPRCELRAPDAFASSRSSESGRVTTGVLSDIFPGPLVTLIAAFSGRMRGTRAYLLRDFYRYPLLWFPLGASWKLCMGATATRLAVNERKAQLVCMGRSVWHVFTLDGIYCGTRRLAVDIDADQVCALGLQRNVICAMDRTSGRISVRRVASRDEAACQTYRFSSTFGDVRAVGFDRGASGSLITAGFKFTAKTKRTSSLCVHAFARLASGSYSFHSPTCTDEESELREADTRLEIAVDLARERIWVAETRHKEVLVYAVQAPGSQKRVSTARARLIAENSHPLERCFLVTHPSVDGVLAVTRDAVIRLDAQLDTLSTRSLPVGDRFDGPISSVAFHEPTSMLYVAAGARVRALQLSLVQSSATSH